MRASLLNWGVVAGLVILGLSAPAQEAALPPDTDFNSSAGRGDVIWIKLRSDSAQDYVFSVDTGATVTVLDKSWEHKLEPHPTQTVTGARWAVSGVFTAPPLLLGGVPLQMGKVVVTEDLAAHYPGRAIDGILGMDCLGRYCIQFDFLENKIRFLDPGRLNAQELGKSFPISPVLGCFFVNDNVAGIGNFHSMIDTGCNIDAVLAPELFRQWMSPAQAGAHYPDGVLGGVAYNNLCVAGNGEQNLIGLHFLARNLVTLNFPGRMLYLQQRSAGPPPGDDGYFSGFYKHAVRTN